MNHTYTCYASSAFGMEGLVAGELRHLGFTRVSAENGGVTFEASAEDLFRCNLMMHFSDRIFVMLRSGICKTFSELFDLVSSFRWSEICVGDEAINVSCKCSRSMLMSPRDCQSITKKAIIESLRRETGRSVFPESGAPLPVLLTVRNDQVRILLNTSGAALSRRGYRTWNGEAPLRETLAAALVRLSPWHPGIPLHDPCCGTGTILIEAGLVCADKAPGLEREFAMETLKPFRKVDFSGIRRELAARADPDRIREISGSDSDPEALKLAERHLIQAGFRNDPIRLMHTELQNLKLDPKQGVFICNPPYGERMSDQKSCRALYRELNMLRKRHPGWSLCAISSDPAFERSFGARADQKRRLYNGTLECVYYIYH